MLQLTLTHYSHITGKQFQNTLPVDENAALLPLLAGHPSFRVEFQHGTTAIPSIKANDFVHAYPLLRKASVGTFIIPKGWKSCALTALTFETKSEYPNHVLFLTCEKTPTAPEELAKMFLRNTSGKPTFLLLCLTETARVAIPSRTLVAA